MGKHVLTIEQEYCSNWSIKDALREIIQNSIDAGTQVNFSKQGKYWEIKDNGKGIKLSDFLLGRSSKKNDNTKIGQFGEGIKIGALVLAREKKEVIIYSQNKRIITSLQHDDEWNSELLTLEVTDYPTSKGTIILVECNDEEIEAAKSLFLKFADKDIVCKAGRTEMLNSPGDIYVNGVLVTHIKSLFGYNFKGKKELINRDRSAIDYESVKSAVAETFGYLSNIEIIKKVLTEAIKLKGSRFGNSAEFDIYFSPKVRCWAKAIKELFGDKVCLSSDPKSDLQSISFNWAVMDLPWALKFNLRGRVCIASDNVIPKKRKYVLQRNLSSEEREMFKKGKEIAKYLAMSSGIKEYPAKVFEASDETENIEGIANGGVIEINRRILKGKLDSLLGVFMHEYVHCTLGNIDNSNSFENDLTEVIGKLGYLLAQLTDGGRLG